MSTRVPIPANIDFRSLLGRRVYRADVSFEVGMVRVFDHVAYIHPKSDPWGDVGYTFWHRCYSDGLTGWEWDG